MSELKKPGVARVQGIAAMIGAGLVAAANLVDKRKPDWKRRW